MCGIAGIAGVRDPELLRSMTRALVHRGPDDEGFLEDGEVGLGARRLSIVDLESGRQPLSGENGLVSVVFNGEIYNHPELRGELRSKGHEFRTRSDTETIVHLYEDLREGCLEKLRGMFAFAIFDKRDGSVFLARDRLGVKPLYYAENSRVLYFASELRALMRAPIARSLDGASVRQYVDLLYVSSPHTLFDGARKLEPGAWLRWRKGKPTEHGRMRALAPATSYKEGEEAELDRLIRASVREQRVADVPVGLFLSGGLDSSALAACLAEEGAAVEAYCMRTGRPGFDEWDKASQVAKIFGLKLNEVPVPATPDLDDFLSAVDEPLADSSAIATWWVSRACRGRLKAAMTGIGGDELFGGYPRYQGLRWLETYGRLPLGLRNVLARAGAALPDMEGSRNPTGWARRFLDGGRLDSASAYRHWLGHAPRELFSSQLSSDRRDPVLEAFDAAGGDALQKAMRADLSTYLPDDLLALADRSSMAAGLELRVPLLDERLVEFALGLPSSSRADGLSLKKLLKTWLRRRLPAELVEQKKRGFMVPMSAWLRGELKEPLRDALSESTVRRRGLFEPAVVARLVDEHLSGRRSRPDLLWALLLLELWQRKHLPESTVSVSATKARLLVVSDFHFSDSEGGAGRVALETAKDLARRGHLVSCWGPSADGREGLETIDGLTIARAPVPLAPDSPLGWPAYVRKAREHLAAFAARHRPQAVLAHQPRAALIAGGVSALAGSLRLYFFHSCWADEYRIDHGPGVDRELAAFGREALERSALRPSSRVFVLSRFMERRLSLHGVDASRVKRVPAGVDLERFHPGEPRGENGAVRLLTVRNLRARMGLENLLAAFAELRKDRPDAMLTIAGYGPLEKRLKSQAESLELSDSVVFAGRVADADLPQLYRSSDLFVLPSREHEGLGLVLLEALASGLPAVGTPVGGIPEVLEPIEPGWIADDVSPTALLGALLRALPDAADAARRNECRRYAEGFPWSATGAAVEEALLAVL